MLSAWWAFICDSHVAGPTAGAIAGTHDVVARGLYPGELHPCNANAIRPSNSSPLNISYVLTGPAVAVNVNADADAEVAVAVAEE